MASIQQIREKYPMYANVSDEQLLRGLHGKFYSQMPFEQFSSKIEGFNAPVVEQQKQVIEPERTAIEKAGDVARSGVIGLAKGATLGYAPDIVSAITGEPVEDIKKREQLITKKSPTAELVGEIGGMLLPGGAIGKGVGAAAELTGEGLGWAGRSLRGGGMLAQGAAGGAEESLRKGGDTALGVGAGAVLGPVAGKVAEVGAKAIKGIAPGVEKLLVKTAGEKDIAKVVQNPNLTEKLMQGIDADRGVASQVKDKVETAIIDTPNRVVNTIQKTAGIDDINKFAKQAQDEYAGYMQSNAGKTMDQGMFSDLVQNRRIAGAISDVKQVHPELRSLPDNSLPVLQEANHLLRVSTQSLGDTGSAELAKTSAKNLRDAMSRGFDNFDSAQELYKKSVAPKRLVDELSSLKGMEASDFGKKLSTVQNRGDLASALGSEKADEVMSALRKESDTFRTLKSLETKSVNREQGRGTLGTLVNEAVKNPLMSGGGALTLASAMGADIDPRIGLGLMGSNVARKAIGGALGKKAALNILSGQGTETASPLLKALAAQYPAAALTGLKVEQ